MYVRNAVTDRDKVVGCAFAFAGSRCDIALLPMGERAFSLSRSRVEIGLVYRSATREIRTLRKLYSLSERVSERPRVARLPSQIVDLQFPPIAARRRREERRKRKLIFHDRFRFTSVRERRLNNSSRYIPKPVRDQLRAAGHRMCAFTFVERGSRNAVDQTNQSSFDIAFDRAQATARDVPR